jgi:acyl-CoA reductase-like NAD-dependent aldehyde dehydrogenase
MSVPAYGNLIGGHWDFDGKETIIYSPVDGSVLATAVMADEQKTDEAIDSAAESFHRVWSRFPSRKRRQLILRLAERMQSRADEYARLESLNTGKVFRQSLLMDIPLAIEHMRYFSGVKFNFSRRIVHPEYPGTRGVVQHAPMGVVAAIAPWNVPLLMAVWKIAPALLAGNTVVLKPSHYTPLTAFELARDAMAAGIPPGVLNVLTGEGSTVGGALARSSKVNMLSFTGSTSTGKKILGSASSAIKKTALELGGKSPNIVFADADLERAAKGVVFGIYLNSGQLCESGSRLLVQKEIRDEFVEKIKRILSLMKPGNPMDMLTDISAITTLEQKRKIETMVETGLREGANVLFRKELGKLVPDGGFYFPPLLVSDVTSEMELGREEVFGPVLSVMEFEREKDAVEIANDTRYGLASGVWTKDIRKALRVGRQIEAGTVWINDYHLLSAAAPRGGFKESGIGRELGFEGILEYTQTRHLFVNSGNGAVEDIAYGLVVPE